MREPGVLLAKHEGSRASERELWLIVPPRVGPGLWIVPMLSWYDLSLDLSAIEPATAPRAADMASFTFTDFALCRWPASMEKPADTLTGK